MYSIDGCLNDSSDYSRNRGGFMGDCGVCQGVCVNCVGGCVGCVDVVGIRLVSGIVFFGINGCGGSDGGSGGTCGVIVVGFDDVNYVFPGNVVVEGGLTVGNFCGFGGNIDDVGGIICSGSNFVMGRLFCIHLIFLLFSNSSHMFF